MLSKSPPNKSQDPKLSTDFSQGDPQASVCVPSVVEENLPCLPNKTEAEFLNRRQKLGGSTCETYSEESEDSESWPWDKSGDNGPPGYSPSRHVNFKTYSKQSIDDLRKESRTLLSARSVPVIPATLEPTISDISNSATIFQLCWDDRQRVGQLIGELASSQAKIYKLEMGLSKSKNRETKYKQKSSYLMKKVDALGEKSDMLQNETVLMKENHLESLNLLQEKITTIAHEFEASVKEIQRLTLENKQLKAEIVEINAKKKSLQTKVQITQESNLQTKALLDSAIKRETEFRNQIQELSKNLDQKTHEEQVYKQIAKNLQNRLKSTSKKLEKHKTEYEKTLKLKYLESPLILTEKNSEPSITAKQNSSPSSIADTPSGTCNVQAVDQKEDAILQDLFFRF